MKYLLILNFFALYNVAYGALAGGRPNSFSEGQNAFAGVVNPANAVWIADRFDIGGHWVNQKASFINRDDNRFFPPGKIDFTYKSRNLFTADAAIQKQFCLDLGSHALEGSVGLAAYTLPSTLKLRTKLPLRIIGTTPLKVTSTTNGLSAIFSFKLGCSHSIGFSLDYLYLSHLRNGYQNSDNPLRSVSPGHVTNKGTDHSHGLGLVVGWRWKITDHLDFGVAWSKKSYCGRFRKYRGFEPHHAKNYTPQILGGGFTYRFATRWAGRFEVLWINYGNLPNANNNVLRDGSLNLNRRGSDKSPGPGLQNATLINLGIGCQLNSMLALGVGYSHRIKNSRHSPLILSHIYMTQTIYDILSFGANLNYHKQNLFLVVSHGFRHSVSGLMPIELGGGRFTGRKQYNSVSLSWGYQY